MVPMQLVIEIELEDLVFVLQVLGQEVIVVDYLVFFLEVVARLRHYLVYSKSNPLALCTFFEKV